MTDSQIPDNGPEIRTARKRGYVTLVDAEIPCAVLDNGLRIISQTGLFDAFKRPRKGEKRQENLPSIIGAKNLLPFVTQDLMEKAQVVTYLHSNGTLAYGYAAELIPLVCRVYVAAGAAGKLHASQLRLAVIAEAILNALEKVGMVALVDEATGEQYDREKDALQKLLRLYVAEDFLKWQSRFPRKFYQEIFRIHGLPYDPLTLKRPQFLGHFTNKFVYELMPPGVLETLRMKIPKNANGQRPKKLHQGLTEDVGITHLDRHLTKLITVMELSNGKADFESNFARVFRRGDDPQLQLFSE